MELIRNGFEIGPRPSPPRVRISHDLFAELISVYKSYVIRFREVQPEAVPDQLPIYIGLGVNGASMCLHSCWVDGRTSADEHDKWSPLG